ncbi:AcrR family transcriptional regulator [Allocatelliglobosispora scoriae]|uniref:AcrR family transcriptional regulator n=1 Tax=Allocatelliglobosispora scoriae TaxID=643052 RepID=A0A841C3C5_9ACTN|nr:TetR family transcriptional regulator [Allocatelliglobosispora scoriae]MBB5873552.1 AcrR family transcriptional regulator [Allocatelliglobosispora scoriae]
MSARTVDWTGLGTAADTAPGEGLRERKKRLMRQQLSDTATEMFLERGFDAVRVADVARACGVSEKTVFNYFPTKESLVLDRWDTTREALLSGLDEPDGSPVAAVLRILDRELAQIMGWLGAQEDPVGAARAMLRFGELMRATPSLRAHQRDVADELTAAAAARLAERAGVEADDPQPQIAAIALLGLWQIQAASLRKHLDGTQPTDRIRDAVTADVRRAADLIQAGLGDLE